MQLMTWNDNNYKGRMSDKNKLQCSEMSKKFNSKVVVQMDLDFNFIRKFDSTHAVEREIGIDSSCIARACRLGGISHKYRWKYE